MPRDDRIFGDVVTPSVRFGSRRWYAVPLSILAHVGATGILVMVPLMASDILPAPRSVLAFVAAAAPPAPPAPPPPPRQSARAPTAAVNRDAAPVEPPPTIDPEPLFDTSFEVIAQGPWVPGGVEPGAPDGAQVGPPPPPPPPEPQRVGGRITEPVKTKHVAPAYPPLAQRAGVAGIVLLEATIGTDGRVQDARVLRSVPLLDQAALDAVRQWEFTPTRLNGVPVPVIMTVTVVFTVGRDTR